jgi:hypothetical protein
MNEDNYTAFDLDQVRPEGVAAFEQAVPWWLRRRHGRYEGTVEDGNYAGEVSVLVGWPVRLLWCSWQQTGTDFVVMRDTGIEIEKPAGPVTSGFLGLNIKESYSRALPYRPVLTGQLINGAMCAGIVLLVRQGSGAARRRQRRRAGRCANCSYDLRGSISGVCPECGSGVA